MSAALFPAEHGPPRTPRARCGRGPRNFPAQPLHDDVFCKDLPKPKHNPIHEWQQYVNRDAREQRERACLRAQRRVEHRERRRPRLLWRVVRVMVVVPMLVGVKVRGRVGVAAVGAVRGKGGQSG